MSWKKLWSVSVVLLIYACTGMTAVFVSGTVSGALGLQKWSASWWLAWLFVIFPLYQVLLLSFAFLFSKYQSFRARYSRLLGGLRARIGLD